MKQECKHKVNKTMKLLNKIRRFFGLMPTFLVTVGYSEGKPTRYYKIGTAMEVGRDAPRLFRRLNGRVVTSIRMELM